MEKVFDIHIHYTFDIPLQETVTIFKEEFTATQTDSYCFLSLPHHAAGDMVTYDEMQNIKGLYLKHAFSPNAYAFAGLVHPTDHSDTDKVAESFLKQAQEYLSVGYDGIKMLEGYPSLLKAWGVPLNASVYDKFYAFMEGTGYPILLHMANPTENWDIEKASPQAIAAGRVYDFSYPTKQEITRQVFAVMEKFPNLKLILAHFGFFSEEISIAEEFLAYPNTMLDITPGGEQLINMQKAWNEWLPFWEKYQNRILYGTDFYAFPKDENWEIAYTRRPNFVRQFLETNSKHTYLDEVFEGVLLNKELRNKIYRENSIALLGEPKTIDYSYMLNEAKRLSAIEKKSSAYADEDLEHIIKTID